MMKSKDFLSSSRTRPTPSSVRMVLSFVWDAAKMLSLGIRLSLIRA